VLGDRVVRSSDKMRALRWFRERLSRFRPRVSCGAILCPSMKSGSDKASGLVGDIAGSDFDYGDGDGGLGIGDWGFGLGFRCITSAGGSGA